MIRRSILPGLTLRCAAIVRTHSTLPKLRYFDAKGAGELIRILFTVANQPFEDHRYPMVLRAEKGFDAPEFLQDCAKGILRANMNRIPVLDLPCGVQIGHPQAIERYVANQNGLMGSSPEEAALIDTVSEHTRSIKRKWSKMRYCPAESQKAFVEKFFAGGQLTMWLKKLEGTLPQSSHEYAVGNKLSYADICIWHLLRDFFPAEHLKRVKSSERAARCARLTAITDKVSQLSTLKEYLERRRDSVF